MSHDQPTVIVDSGASYRALTANELADELENATSISEVARLVKEKVIPTLRQQQTEIEALKVKYRQEFEYVEKKFSDEWWQGVEEFNKKAQEK